MGVIQKKFKIGLATFAQPTFDVSWAESVRTRTLDTLEQLGVEVVAFPRPLMYEQEALEFRDALRQADVSAVFLQCAGFSFGGLPVIISTGVDVPCIIWATPEPEWTGDVIRSNSLCAGIMHNSHLKRAGVDAKFIFGNPEEMVDELKALIKALRAITYLKNSKLGIVGYRAPGFYVSGHNEMKLHAELGVQTFHVDLSSVMGEVERIADEAAEEVIQRYGFTLAENVVENRAALLKTVKVYLALRKIAEEKSLDILAVKCWPEFPFEQGVSVCLALSLLNDNGIITACEGDAYGAVTMLIQDLLGEGPEFFNDIIQIDEDNNHMLFWHCGSAAACLKAPEADILVRPHGMQKKVGAVNFPLKPGRVTVSRLTEQGGSWKMFVATGEAVDTPMLLQGNPSLVKMDAPVKRILDTILEEGFEHHHSTIYGDISRELQWFCELMNMEMVKPE